MLVIARLQITGVYRRKVIFTGEQIVKFEAARAIRHRDLNQLRLADRSNFHFRSGERRISGGIDDNPGELENRGCWRLLAEGVQAEEK